MVDSVGVVSGTRTDGENEKGWQRVSKVVANSPNLILDEVQKVRWWLASEATNEQKAKATMAK